jgi:DNA primase
MRISKETIEKVRERSQITDLFGSTELKKSGREFLAHCPWHEDHRPSLTVSPKTNRAYCFVCARGVDPIGWLQDQRGMTFTDAVVHLADFYKIPVEVADAEDQQRYLEEKKEKEKLFAEREQIQSKLHAAIWDSPGFSYLLSRGLNQENIKEWGLGWNGSRVTFPLCNEQGRTVAHTGRVLDDSKPKYKNSTNSLIYQKSEMVFGLSKARDEIIKKSHVVICEGQMDVIRCWQEGLRNMVAVSGSSLTAQMIERIIMQTRAKKITLCFDGDNAGTLAAHRARRELMPLALKGEVQLAILSMPAGKDPADLAETMADEISNSPNWVEWWMNTEFLSLDLDTADGVVSAERIAKTILKELPDGSLREFVKSRCKQLLNAVPLVAPAKIKTNRELDQWKWAERRAARLYLLDPGSRPALDSITFKDPWILKAFELIKTLEMMTQNKPEILASAFARIISIADLEEQAELMSLVYPIPEVRRVVESNPIGELEAAMNVLLTGDDGK